MARRRSPHHDVALMSFALSFTHAVAPTTSGLRRGISTSAARRQGAFVVEAKQNKEARAKQSANERLYNKARKSEITTRMKKVFMNAQALMAADSCSESDISGLEKLISEATKSVDKAVARGTLHKNTGARRKARMSKYKMDVRVAKGLYTA